MTSDNVKNMIKEEIAEENEKESKKLNVMCFKIAESKRSDVKERQNVIMNQSYKCRPLRFSVRSFQVQRELLEASMSLRETNDEMFSNINFTPDLT